VSTTEVAPEVTPDEEATALGVGTLPGGDDVPAAGSSGAVATAIDVDQLGTGEAGDVCTSPDVLAAAVMAAARPRDRDWLTIAEVAEHTGVTAHTLRYYERIGLIEVPRDPAGRRRYHVTEVGRVVFISRLRQTAMPIRDIQAYFRLVAAGPGNEDQRLALLERHRDQVRAQLAELRSSLSVIDFKVAMYGGRPS
jgi:DNA-binding transcriptional MerR regulator